MFRLSPDCHWPGPRSLAATSGVSVDVLSYGYLDVSVPRVPFLSLCIQDKIPFIDTWKPETPSRAANGEIVNGPQFTIHHHPFTRAPRRARFPSIKGGFPHSEIHGSKRIRSSPWLIAAYHVLHRLCMPRHPPNALTTLDRSHCQCPCSRTDLAERPASRDLSDGAVRQPIMLAAIGAWPPTLQHVEPGQIFSLRCVQNRRRAEAGRKPFSSSR